MRKLVTLAILATMVATPAVAQTDQTLPEQPGQTAAAPWDAVVVRGKVVGKDPDANVRLNLLRGAYGGGHN